MSIKLNGATSGSVELDVPAAVTGGDVSLSLPGAGTVDRLERAGNILQVVQTHVITTSSQSISASTRVELSGLSVNITPTTSTSDMLIFARWCGEHGTSSFNSVFGIRRDSTDIGNPASAGSRQVGITTLAQNYYYANNDSTPDTANWFFMDESRSSGTSQITYKATFQCEHAGTLYNQRTVTDADTSGFERLTSSIIVMEVAA